MKKILVLSGILVIAGFMLVAVPAFAAKPNNSCVKIQDGSLVDSNGGFLTVGYDKWGYNYQAKMFNGWYGNYSRPSVPVVSGDSLIMKWNDAWLSNQDCDGDGKLDRHLGFSSYKGSGAWLTNHASGTYESSTNYVWEVNTSPNKLDIPWAGTTYSYDVSFVKEGAVLTGTLTDGYYPTTNSLIGTIDGNNVTFSFIYPVGSVQGIRTYVGTIDSAGKVSGTWSETGTENATGSWSIAGFATKIPEMCSWSDFVKIVAVPEDAINDGGVWKLNDKEIGPVIWGEFAIIQEVSSNPCGEDMGLMDFKSDIRSGLGNW
ncbi:TPA: hypothetical protein DIC38_02245 [Candidatus Nomurabacteria bacterium]|nr:MAG: hypothetical protein O210_OD1C00001G0282 [Parcubacteria bacterium RAAC4_OD1_1]HCY26476.1 hypothetical protein [Candidatus Nomurabacteria bacterium]